MAKLTWAALPRKVRRWIPNGESLDQPTEAEVETTLDDYESQAGFRLPASYRIFVHSFGPGELSEWFQISVPIPVRLRGRVADVHDIDKQREMLSDPDGFWATTVGPEILRRFVLFASTGGGDWFFWDTADVRNNRDHEYGVYGHEHGSRGKLDLIAPNFKVFVTDVCLGDRYPFGNQEREPNLSFRPAWPTMT